MRALVRGIPGSFANALSAAPPDPPIDIALARVQHRGYCDALVACGVTVTELAADPTYPDCCFVEDTAVVAEGLALITRPGAISRRGEVRAVADILASYLDTAFMKEPATLDGGDCMRVGNTLYVGRSARTNREGVAELRDLFSHLGLTVVEIDLPEGVLHLQCVVTSLGDGRILLAEETIDESRFDAEVVWVPRLEAYAANVVAIENHVIVADGFPRTRDALSKAGFETHPVATSEAKKADGSLTCQSILW